MIGTYWKTSCDTCIYQVIQHHWSSILSHIISFTFLLQTQDTLQNCSSTLNLGYYSSIHTKRLASKVICLKNILVLTFFREYIPKLASWVQNHAQLFVRNKTFFYGWNCSFNPELFFIFNFFGMYFLSCARHCVCLMFFFITITMFKFICESIIVKAVVHNISFHCFIMYLGFIGIRLLLLA